MLWLLQHQYYGAPRPQYLCHQPVAGGCCGAPSPDSSRRDAHLEPWMRRQVAGQNRDRNCVVMRTVVRVSRTMEVASLLRTGSAVVYYCSVCAICMILFAYRTGYKRLGNSSVGEEVIKARQQAVAADYGGGGVQRRRSTAAAEYPRLG